MHKFIHLLPSIFNCNRWQDVYVRISPDAKFLEQFYINKYDALGTSGENILQGHPPSCRRYWAMFRSGSLH